METPSGYSPVVVMVEREKADGEAAREWVEQSPYTSCEAHDVFEAIEEMADVTMPYRPDVIVLDADRPDAEVLHTLEVVHPNEASVQVLTVSEPDELPSQIEMLVTHAPND